MQCHLCSYSQPRLIAPRLIATRVGINWWVGCEQMAAAGVQVGVKIFMKFILF